MKIRIIFSGFITLFSSFHINAAVNQKNYPHWNLKKPENIAILEKIDRLIEENQGKAAVAVFDWDGTVYDEKIQSKETLGAGHIKSSQAVWHVWAAHHATHPSYENLDLFPHYRDCDRDCILKGLILKDDYLEGLTPNQKPIDNYSKFSQIAVMEAGMTPDAFTQGVHAYEQKYPVSRFAFLPMFDVIQQMINHGFKVWFVSGSNPYFIAALLKKIEKMHPRYDFSSITQQTVWPNKSCAPSNRIIGNHAKLYQGRFTRIYEDQYIERQTDEPLHAIVGEGKAIAIQRFIGKRDKGSLVFAAGNSSGDIEMMTEVSKTPNNLLLAINPEHKLAQFIQKQPTALTLKIAEDLK